MKKRILAAVLAILMIAPVLAGVSVFAADEPVVGYSSPAICTDAGKEIKLSGYSVQFEHGAEPVAADKITWKEGGKAVTSFTPSAKGVYALTATAGAKTKNIYVVAKNADEKEYVLYENDFSSAPDLSQFRVIQQPSGTTFGYDAAEGAIYLESTKNTSDMIRVLLPEFLDSFGDAIYSADMKITKQMNKSRWCSLVIRQQNVKTTKLPYLQVVSRYDNSADNGLEIAERTANDAWNVVEKGACSGVKGGEYFTITADFCGTTVKNSINGKTYLTETMAPYYDGAMGLQANGSRMTVSKIKITVNPESSYEATVPLLHDTRDVSSNIALAPVLITEVTTSAQLAALDTALPAVAIMDAELNGSALGVALDGKFIAAADAVPNSKVIPAYRVNSKEEAEALGKYAKSFKMADMYVISSDMALITAARKKCSLLYGMLEMNAAPDDIEALRSDIIECGARGALFTGEYASRESVSYLQDRYLSVWQKTDGSDVSTVTAINNGVLGILTPDVAAAEKCFTEYYTKNTLIRTPEIIGHRGIPSKAQENSLAGALLAIKEGATMVECDVYLMKDGEIVVMHDGTLDRTTSGVGNTADQTADSIKKYQIDSFTGADPEPIPLLDDLLEAFKESGEVLVIELKSSNTALCAKVVERIEEYGMEKQCVIIAFSQDMIKAIRKASPGISVNFLTSSISANEQMSIDIAAQIIDIIAPLNTAYSPSYSAGTLGPNLYADLAARGVTVWNWTVNNRDNFNKYFISGIRGITTNYSDWAANYVEEFTVEINGEGGIELKATNYKGGNVNTRDAQLVVIGGTGEYKDGKVTLSEGAQGYFFRMRKTLSDSTAYSVVTPVISVGDSGLSADQTTESAVVTPNGSEAEGGCGSMISIPVAALVMLGAAVTKKKRK